MNKARLSRAGVVAVCLIALCCIVGVVLWFLRETKQPVDVTPIENQVTTVENANEIQTPDEDETPKIDTESLQKVVDEWVGSVPNELDVSIVITSVDGKVLAQHNPEKSYFTASLYKLFVAYEGYRALDAGELTGSETFQAGRTVSECLDAMIRESDSPCGERMWTELGKSTIDENIKLYGITATDMVGLQTTAADTAAILARIARGEGLSESSHAAYLDSMKTQPALYRRGLPSGFSEALTVYNKVGWNEQLEWHDGAIVERKDGERFILTTLTRSIGSKKIVELAQNLEAIFLY